MSPKASFVPLSIILRAHLPVTDVVSAGVMDFDDDKHMLEMRADVFWSEGKGPGLLEYDGDDVIADMPLP